MKLIVLSIAALSTGYAAIPSVGPDYVRPSVESPPAYREAPDSGSWKVGEPADSSKRGEWWTLFGDPDLDRLEQFALARNQDLRAAAARVEEAAAAAGLAQSAAWPQLAANPSVVRGRTSDTTTNPFPNKLSTDFSAPLLMSWELDIFGRVRRLSEASRADAEASAATFESVRLSLTANVAATYFSLRGADREAEIVSRTVGLRRRELEIVAAQRRSGTGTELDVARAETELASTETDLDSIRIRRESLQDALAVLAGETATSFQIAISTGEAAVPVVAPGIPSDLLERRPDIAAAERSLSSANARIGVAKAAFFPAISLTGEGGFESADTANLLKADSRIWSIGPSLYLPIFQGGRNAANLRRARAAYDESVATFRQQVLVAFREVQEALTVARLLQEQSASQDQALVSSERASRLAQTRYMAGYTSYLDVIDAERTELSNERFAAQLTTSRLTTAIALVKALGGGWSTNG